MRRWHGDRRSSSPRVHAPFATRVGGIVELLVAEGAADGQLDAIAATWFEVLATRHPDVATPSIDLTADIDPLVGRTAAAHVAASGSWFDDSSLVSGADTPLTDADLAGDLPRSGHAGWPGRRRLIPTQPAALAPVR